MLLASSLEYSRDLLEFSKIGNTPNRFCLELLSSVFKYNDALLLWANLCCFTTKGILSKFKLLLFEVSNPSKGMKLIKPSGIIIKLVLSFTLLSKSVSYKEKALTVYCVILLLMAEALSK